jgi:uncharacterized protein (DUF58 family)
MHWPARRVTRGLYQGGHRSRRVGSSPEFMQYREYRQGDEPSKIDWKLYARTGRIAVRQTHDDSSFRTSVLLDASASMAYPQPTLAKWNLAASVAFGLCAVAQGDRDPVGLAVVSGGDLQLLPPRARMSTTANVLRMLMDVVPSGARPLAPVLAMLRTSNRIAIVSDFLGDAEALLEQAGEMVASGREVFAVHVVAREELEPRDLGNLVVDPEEETVRRPLDATGLAEYRRAYAEWREALAASWRAAGAVYQLAVTDQPADGIIRQVVTPAAISADTSTPS